MNLFLSIIFIILSFVMLLLFYKMYKKLGLFLWIVIAMIVCNIQALKLVEIFSVDVALGGLLYATLFTATNILNEKYGKNEAMKSIGIGVFSMLAMSVLMYVAVLFVPSSNDFVNESLTEVFKLNLRVAIGTIISFAASQYINIYIYNKLKDSGKMYMRSNISTILAQVVDKILFTIIAFVGIIPMSNLILLMIVGTIFGVVISIISTPVLYIAKNIDEE